MHNGKPMRIAVIGAGISGLAAAYYLSRRHEVHVFEREPRLGGHTNTVMVGDLPIDTGFIVHNEHTYPNFCGLMQELGVATQWSDMSFAVTSPDYEYGSGGFFAQRSNLLSPSHWALLFEILRFNREAVALSERLGDVTLDEFLSAGRFGRGLRERYLIPMASAIWSMPFDEMGGFPAATLIRFFENHGLLGVNTHPRWKTIVGGSHCYLDPITRPYRERITLNVEIRSVERHDDHITLRFADREAQTFDHVVLACHGPQARALLGDPTAKESEVLAHFTTTKNDAWLHTDARMLPRRKTARASWNYWLGDNGRVTVTYHMNRLQALDAPEEYCVTLNPNTGSPIAPERVLQKMVYHHPRFNKQAVAAQARWGEISGQHRTHYCGAYWFYGFHEDGVRSALRVAETLGA